MVRKLTIAYLGQAYAGWQRQSNAVTVQQVVEEALSALAGEPLTVTGAGRTDAGVHARGQVAHFEGGDRLPDRALVHGCNHRLPDDVRILRAVGVAEAFHARKHALSKIYSYRMLTDEVISPLDAPFAVGVDPRIDVDVMSEACARLAGTHDFSAFALAGGGHSSPQRTIFEASCTEESTGLWFRVRGSGFLRGMVRSLAGTLIEVGTGRRSIESFADLLSGAPRSAAGPTAPARGLTLERVFYDDCWTAIAEDDGPGAVVD